jgi:ParB family chromosome partitioning protein
MALDLSALDYDAGIELRVHALGVAARAPLDKFEEDPENPRFEADAEAFDALVADVRERGILQPIVVRRAPDGRLRIRFGARRFRAAILLALADAPYVVTEDERQFDDYAQISENERRLPLQPLELATFIAKKLAHGEKKKAIAARLGIDPGALTHLLALTGDVPLFVLDLYHSRKCRSPRFLYRLRRLGTENSLLVTRRCVEAVDIDLRFIEALTEEVAQVPRVRLTAKDENSQDGAALDSNRKQEKVSQTGRDEPPTPPALASTDSAETKGEVSWPRLARPQLIGNFDGQSVRLNFSLRPSSPTFVVIIDELGGMREVPIGEVSLTHLLEMIA